MYVSHTDRVLSIVKTLVSELWSSCLECFWSWEYGPFSSHASFDQNSGSTKGMSLRSRLSRKVIAFAARQAKCCHPASPPFDHDSSPTKQTGGTYYRKTCSHQRRSRRAYCKNITMRQWGTTPHSTVLKKEYFVCEMNRFLGSRITNNNFSKKSKTRQGDLYLDLVCATRAFCLGHLFFSKASHARATNRFATWVSIVSNVPVPEHAQLLFMFDDNF